MAAPTKKTMLLWLVALGAGLVGAGAFRLHRQRSGKTTAAPNQAQTDPQTGRQHIDQALDRLYPSVRDHRFGLHPAPGEAQAPLAEVVAYRASKPIHHWHYVTYGLSELGAKDSKDPSLSGFGVEYTLRLVDNSGEPPAWPINLLRWLAKLVWQTRAPFDPGHSMNLPKGTLDKVSPGVEGLGFLKDADLGSIETPNGRVTFVNVIPLVRREEWLVGAWDFYKYVEVVRSVQGDLLWRVGRGSILDGERGKEILAQAKRDGSSQSVDYAEVAWTGREIILDDVGRPVIIKFLRYRLAYGRDATIIDRDRKATLSPGDWRMNCSDKTCTASIPRSEAALLADKLAAAGPGTIVSRPHGVRFRVASEH